MPYIFAQRSSEAYRRSARCYLRRVIDYHSGGHVSLLQSLEDVIDRGQGLELDVRLHLAFDAEGERLDHVLAIPDERASHGGAVGHDVKERHRYVSRRQPDQHARAALARHADALPESNERGGGDQNAMGSAASLFLQGRCGIAALCVEYKIGAELLGMIEFCVVDVDRGDEQSHRL